MPKVCDLCKTMNDDDNMFCDKCGNPLDEKQPTGKESSPGASSAQSGIPETEDEVAAREKQKKDMKLMLIPLGFLVVIGLVLLVMFFLAGQKKKQAELTVTNYLNLVKEEQYAKALEEGLDTKIDEKWAEGFKEFKKQLTPGMAVNNELHQAKLALVEIDKSARRYEHINRKLPSSLSDLTPVIMEKLPDAPMGGEYGYMVDHSKENYTIYLKGNVFEQNGVQQDFPAISHNEGLQSPGEKRVFGEWKVTDFEILETEASGDDIRVTVRETAQFGPETKTNENTYRVRKEGEKWLIDPNSTPIEPMTFNLAFTQMADMTELIAKKPEVAEEEEPDKKKKKKKKSKKAKEEDEEKPVAVEKVDIKMPLGMVLISYSKIAEDPEKLKIRQQYQMRKCQEAMDSIAHALGRYYHDNGGQYPLSIQWLIPDYLPAIPINPPALEDTFSQAYEVSDDREVFTVYSKGSYFKDLGIENDYPRYSSTQRYLKSSADIKVIPKDEIVDEDDKDKEPGDDEKSPDETDEKSEEDKTDEESDDEKQNKEDKKDNGKIDGPENGKSDEIKDEPEEKDEKDEKEKTDIPEENPEHKDVSKEKDGEGKEDPAETGVDPAKKSPDVAGETEKTKNVDEKPKDNKKQDKDTRKTKKNGRTKKKPAKNGK